MRTLGLGVSHIWSCKLTFPGNLQSSIRPPIELNRAPPLKDPAFSCGGAPKHTKKVDPWGGGGGYHIYHITITMHVYIYIYICVCMYVMYV